jgi:hypothetical protein
MDRIAVATPQNAWDCKSSRPGFRLAGLEESAPPESVWMCVRTGQRRRLSEHTCKHCPYWEEAVS